MLYFEQVLTVGVRNKTQINKTLNTRLRVAKSCKSYNGYVRAFKHSNVSIEVLHGGHFACQEQYNIIPMGQNFHSNAKHFYWPPCKTSIPGLMLIYEEPLLSGEPHFKRTFPHFPEGVHLTEARLYYVLVTYPIQIKSVIIELYFPEELLEWAS